MNTFAYDYTKTKIKINTSRSELYEFAKSLIHILDNQDIPNDINPFIYRESKAILKRINEKISVPYKAIKNMSFNYYETLTLKYITKTYHIPIDFIEFSEVFRKIDSQFIDINHT